jgi:hypothetical protein
MNVWASKKARCPVLDALWRLRDRHTFDIRLNRNMIGLSVEMPLTLKVKADEPHFALAQTF